MRKIVIIAISIFVTIACNQQDSVINPTATTNNKLSEISTSKIIDKEVEVSKKWYDDEINANARLSKDEAVESKTEIELWGKAVNHKQETKNKLVTLPILDFSKKIILNLNDYL